MAVKSAFRRAGHLLGFGAGAAHADIVDALGPALVRLVDELLAVHQCGLTLPGDRTRPRPTLKRY